MYESEKPTQCVANSKISSLFDMSFCRIVSIQDSTWTALLTSFFRASAFAFARRHSFTSCGRDPTTKSAETEPGEEKQTLNDIAKNA